jgi:4-amino-4-deoxy-L-arabinose transferase-like glycosyltransferase
MVQRGMFLDGMFYASVARNLAAGQGSFWEPSFSKTVYLQYFEHPPLGLTIESAAFRILGDTFATERIYALVMLALAAWVMTRLWRSLLPAEYDWLPLCLWVLPAVVTWGVVNSMLENTMVVATTASVWATVSAARAATARAAVGWALAAGLLIDAAVLIKGPVGLFPLATPVLLAILPATARPQWKWTLGVVAAVFLVSAAAVAFMPILQNATEQYVENQLSPVFSHRPPVSLQIEAVWRHLAGGILIRIAIVPVALWGLARWQGRRPGVPRAAWFFTAVALSASLPLMASPKISGHYFIPSVAMFALAAGAFAWPAIEALVLKAAAPVGRWLPAAAGASLLVAAALVVLLHGVVQPRDVDQVASMDTVGTFVPHGAIIGTCVDAGAEWGLLAFLQRFLAVSLDPTGQPANGWFAQPAQMACAVPPSCTRAATTAALTLYRCSASVPAPPTR